MSIKRKRIGMLIQLNNTISNIIGNIADDAENQTAKILESNMYIIREHVRDILELDGFAWHSRSQGDSK